MGWLTALGMFVVVWWVVLFTTLSLWLKPHQDVEGHFGTAGSAPEKTNLGKKMLLTTLIAFFVWLGIVILVNTGILEGWIS